MKKLIQAAILIVYAQSAFAFSPRPLSSTISGPATGVAGQTGTYTYNDGIVYTTFNWNLVNGFGTVTSSTRTGSTYTAVIKWTAPGTESIQFIANGTTKATKGVTVSCPTLVAPTATFIYPGGTTGCGSVAISYSADDNSSGLTWYWQTTSTGNSFAYPALSYSATVIASQQYFLRAACGTNFGPYQATSSITVKAIPTVSAPAVSLCSGSTSGLVLTNNLAATTNTWTVSNSNASGSLAGSGVSGSSSPFTYTLAQTLNATSNVNGIVTYTVTPSNNGCSGTPVAFPVTVGPIPTVQYTASPASLTVCSGSTATINLSSSSGISGTNFNWTYSESNAGSPAPNAPTSNIITGGYTNLDNINTGSVTYNLYAFTSSPNCVSSPAVVTLNVNPTPIAPTPVALRSYASQLASFSLFQPSGTQARWYATSSSTDTLFTGPTHQNTLVTDPFTYYVSIRNLTNSCESPRVGITSQVVPTIARPSITSESVRVTGITSDGGINGLNTATQKRVGVNYFDGLSRVVQGISISATPSGKDLVQAVEYDPYGNTSKSYLPYATTTATGGAFQSAYTSDVQYFYNSATKVAHDNYPYAISKSEASSFGRTLEQGNVGSDWQPVTSGTPHTQRVTYSYNNGAMADEENEVRMFAADGSSAGFYGANVLSKTKVTDENGNIKITYADPLGRLVAKKEQLGQSINGTTVNYLQTYYVYNEMNQLVYIIPPGGQAALKTSGWSLSPTIKEQQLHQFVYDSLGHVTQKKTPGQDWTYFVYDTSGRLVLSQDGNQRTLNKWAFVKYDQMGRVVMNGLYKNTTQTTLSAVKTLVKNFSGSFYETRGTILMNYTSQSFPTANSDASQLEVLGVNYYDNYDVDNNGSADYIYNNAHLSGLPSLAGKYTRGLVTVSYKLNLGTGNYLKTAVFYDDYDRPIQTQTNNHLYQTVADKTSITYDFEGKVVATKTTHTPDGTTTTDVVQTPTYDNQGRVTQLQHQINGGTNQIVAAYNELGQRVTKQLHNTGGSSYLQTVDYLYNIRGWLSSINDAQLSDATDFFGMELLYNTQESGLGNTLLYNGNVSAIKWKNAGDGTGSVTGQRSYKFAYDKTDKLLTATFQKYGSSWGTASNTQNEAMSYDHNGNILSLVRKQIQRTLSGTTVNQNSQTIDSLLYSYSLGGATSGNMLGKVADQSGNKIGFSDGTNSSDDYTYDTQGNLTADRNKGIDSIKYNVLGKVSRIKFQDGRVMVYTYDGAGTKLKTTLTVAGTATITDYVNGFVYTNGALSFFSSPEGRVVKNGGSFEYQYAISDHQGNTRVLFTSATPTAQSVTAGFETANQTSESANFMNYPSGAHVNTVPSNAHTGNNSLYLNGAPNYQVGLAKTYVLLPGDQVHIQAYAKYNTPSGSSSNLTGFATALLNAFNLSAPGSGETGTPSSGVNNFGAQAAAGYGDGSSDNTDPRVFVTILVFDKNYNFMDIAYQQTTSSGALLSATYTAKEAGYAYVYVSNEQTNQTDVYFDDITMSFTPTRILQVNEYYPFGLQTASSMTRAGTNNNYLYDAGNELNLTTSHYDTPFRNYDPVIGRFNQLDPLSLMSYDYSPYQYANNNPVTFNDPLGLKADRTLRDLLQEMANRGAKSWENDGSEDGKFGYEVNVVVTLFVPDPGGGGGGLDITYTFYNNDSFSANVKIHGTRWTVFSLLPDADISSRDDSSPWDVGWEWLSGKGARSHFFTNGDPFTELLKQHSHIEEVRNMIRSGSRSGRKDYTLGGVRGIGKYIKDYSTLGTGGLTGNLAVTYLGSYNLWYDVISTDGSVATVRFDVTNYSNVGSATHLPYFGYLPGWNSYVATPLNNFFVTGPMSEVSQHFQWTETIKLN